MGNSFEMPLDILPRAQQLDARPVSARDTEVSALPSSSERSAVNKMDSLNLDDKIKMTPEQSNTLRNMEGAILKGDLSSLESTMHKFKDDPQAAKPIMDVLCKDLKSAGLEATYDVDYAMTANNKTEKTGMFSLSNLEDPRNYGKVENSTICFYTNPNSKTWADRNVPRPQGSYISSPESFTVPNDLALKQLGARAGNILLERKIGE